MNYLHHLILYHTVTPLHVGVGQDVGVVDLPVFRERTTGFPTIPGSGIRGAVRATFPDALGLDPEAAQKLGTEEVTSLKAKLFGKDGSKREDDSEPSDEPTAENLPDAGSVAIHDAKLLLFPVRSDRRVFLWITCPSALRRLAREAEVFTPGSAATWTAQLEGTYEDEEQVLAPEALGLGPENDSLHLEQYRFTPAPESDATAADRKTLHDLIQRVETALGLDGLADSTLLVSDRTFHHFVTHATLVLQHNRLDAQKTVSRGQLFSLEAVPPEAVFFGWMGATRGRWTENGSDDEESGPNGTHLDRKHIARLLRRGLGADRPELPAFHFGGQESTGLGVTRLAWVEPAGGGS